MKRLLIIAIAAITLTSCEKDEQERCANCYVVATEEVFASVCESDTSFLQGMTLEEWTEIWDGFTGLDCRIVEP